MIKKLSLLLLVVTFTSLTAQDNLKFEFDYARYAYDSTTVFFEIYYSFDQNDLTIVENDEKAKLVEGGLTISILVDGTSEVIFDRTWNVPSLVSEEKSLYGVLGLFIPDGNYKLNMVAYDKNNDAKRKEFSENLSIKSYNSEKLSISDIQLARNIKKDGADKNSIFYKNTMEVIPNPESLYSNTQPNLFYYAEIYDVKTTCTDKLSYFQILLNGADKEVYRKENILARNPGARIDIGRINLQKLPTDSYKLLIGVADSCNNHTFTAEKQFYFYNPGVFDTTEQVSDRDLEYLSGKFALASEEECDDYFEKAEMIAKQDEIDEFEKITILESKREFLHKFWSKRQGTRFNNFEIDFEEYYKRVDYATVNFRSMGIKGYKSDKGRTYIKYGNPDEIERHPNEPSTKPYEVWIYYSIESGVEFIFGDLNGYGNYQLLHSNKRGETYNENYLGLLQQIN